MEAQSTHTSLSKLTKHQRQELKSLVANATIRRLTSKETADYVLKQLGILIHKDYVRHVRMQLKQDYANELQSLQRIGITIYSACSGIGWLNSSTSRKCRMEL
jgi:transposase